MSAEPHALARRAQIGAAHRAVRKLPRPDGMRPATWLLLKEVLVALNGYLPTPFPSQRDLATKVGISQRYVSDLLVLAEKLGLISRLEKPGRHGERPRHEYRLLYVAPPENSSALDQSTGALAPENWSTPKAVPQKEEPRLASPPQDLPSEDLDDDDGSSSSPEAGWESNRLEAALAALGGGGQVHDPDPDTGWCEACQRLHNRFPGLAERGTGCVECGEDVPRLTGRLSGTSPIHIACEVSPSASQERAALEARLREVRAVERKQVQGARIYYEKHGPQGATYRMAKFPDDYVFPDWWIREGCL